jgi:steroid 5-alpha reductase family enzyme
MAEFWTIYGTTLAILLACMSVLWAISVLMRDASIVDPFWGLTFVISAWYAFFRTPDGNPARKAVVVTLVSVWGLRLALYLLWRNWGRGEDPRYQSFRQRYGPERYWWVSFFQTFMLQGFLAWIIAAPLLGAQIQGGDLNALDGLALLIWVIGFVFEAGSDLQLARFKANPANRGRLLTTGFWRYSRHPNYFGDAACWWGYGLLSLAAGSYLPALGAAVMSYVIIRVSGVSLLERSLSKEKPDYAAYARRTSAFIPWPPRDQPLRD